MSAISLLVVILEAPVDSQATPGDLICRGAMGRLLRHSPSQPRIRHSVETQSSQEYPVYRYQYIFLLLHHSNSTHFSWGNERELEVEPSHLPKGRIRRIMKPEFYPCPGNDPDNEYESYGAA